MSTVTDDFAGSGSLSGSWTASGSTANLVRISGKLATDKAGAGGAFYTGSAFTNDQTSTVTNVSNLATAGAIGLLVRCTGPFNSALPTTGYWGQIFPNNGNYRFRILTIVAGAEGAVLSDQYPTDSGIAISGTDSITFEANGTTIGFKLNGGSFISGASVTNSAYSTGVPGILVYDGSVGGNVLTIESWEGTGANAVDVNPPTVPTLTATADSSSSIQLNWTTSTDDISGVGGYKIYRDGSLTALATVTGTSYHDTGLTASTLYSYKVSSFDNASPTPNESAKSTAATATTLSSGAGTTIIDYFDGTGTLPSPPWTVSSATAGVSNQRYNGKFGNSGPGTSVAFYTGATFSSNQSSQANGLTGLQNGILLFYVRATGPFSGAFPKTGYVGIVAKQSGVNNYFFRCVRVTDGKEELNAQGNAVVLFETNVGIPINSNDIINFIATGTTIKFQLNNVDVLGASATDSSYSSGVPGVGFYDGVGNQAITIDEWHGDGWNEVDVTAPTIPQGLSATTLSSSSIRLQWSASSDSGTGVRGYKVYRDGNSTAIAQVNALAYTDTGLNASTSYSYTVSAYDGAVPPNESSKSSSASATTSSAGTDTTPPSAPTGLSAIPSATSVRLTWNASTDNSGGSGLSGYKIYRDDSSLTVPIATVGTLVTTYTDSTISQGVQYTYRVSAFDVAANESTKTSLIITVPTVFGEELYPYEKAAKLAVDTYVNGIYGSQYKSDNIDGFSVDNIYTSAKTYNDEVYDYTRAGGSPSGPTQWADLRLGQMDYPKKIHSLVSGKKAGGNITDLFKACVEIAKGNMTGVNDTTSVPEYALTNMLRVMDFGTCNNAIGATTSSIERTETTDIFLKAYKILQNQVMQSDSWVMFHHDISDWTNGKDASTTKNFQAVRYGLALCTMGDIGYWTPNDTSGAVVSNSQIYDEQYGGSLNNPNWLGSPLEDPVDTVWEDSVYRREFDNGIVYLNSRQGSEKTITIKNTGFKRLSNWSVVPAGSGGTSLGQLGDPAVNNGTDEDYVLQPGDAIFLARGTVVNDTTVPTAPTNLTATAMSSSEIDLVWDASTDSGTNASGVNRYKVFRNNLFLATIQPTSPKVYYNDIGLSDGTQYTYKVSAVDNSGNESQTSNEASATTQTVTINQADYTPQYPLLSGTSTNINGGKRDLAKHPFNSSSPFNTSIRSSATFGPCFLKGIFDPEDYAVLQKTPSEAAKPVHFDSFGDPHWIEQWTWNVGGGGVWTYMSKADTNTLLDVGTNPIGGSGHSYMWDPVRKTWEPQILGTLSSTAQLPATSPLINDAYQIGNRIWIWTGSNWRDTLGEIVTYRAIYPEGTLPAATVNWPSDEWVAPNFSDGHWQSIAADNANYYEGDYLTRWTPSKGWPWPKGGQTTDSETDWNNLSGAGNTLVGTNNGGRLVTSVMDGPSSLGGSGLYAGSHGASGLTGLAGLLREGEMIPYGAKVNVWGREVIGRGPACHPLALDLPLYTGRALDYPDSAQSLGLINASTRPEELDWMCIPRLNNERNPLTAGEFSIRGHGGSAISFWDGSVANAGTQTNNVLCGFTGYGTPKALGAGWSNQPNVHLNPHAHITGERVGALLAIPYNPSPANGDYPGDLGYEALKAQMLTEAGRMFLWTFTYYGGYHLDTTPVLCGATFYTSGGNSLPTKLDDFCEAFVQYHKHPFACNMQWTTKYSKLLYQYGLGGSNTVDPNRPLWCKFSDDFDIILRALRTVTNNGPPNQSGLGWGGGTGTPLQPSAPT